MQIVLFTHSASRGEYDRKQLSFGLGKASAQSSRIGNRIRSPDRSSFGKVRSFEHVLSLGPTFFLKPRMTNGKVASVCQR